MNQSINYILIAGIIVYGITYTETILLKGFIANKIINSKRLSDEKVKLITEMISKQIRVKDLLQFLR